MTPSPVDAISPVPARQPRFHYAWVMAAMTFLVLLGASGFRSAPSILIVPLQDAFGWSRATISLAVSINLILFGFMGPFAAASMERFGLRRVVTAALITVATGSALTIFMNAPWQLYLLWGVLVGLGTGSMATVLAATVANRWFVKRRGLVMGALTAASATGQLIFLPGLAWLVANHGWKSVSIAVAATTLAVIPLVLIFGRNRPADIGLRPYGATETDLPVPPRVNPIGAAFASLRIAVTSRDFWLLAGSFFICGATTNGLIGTHLIPAGVDHGLSEVAAANLLAFIGIFDIIGTTVSGWLTDRYDARRLLFAYYGFRGLSLMVLPWAFGSPHAGLILFIVFYGLDWVATVPPTVALTAKSFGVGQAPLIFGWIFAAHQVGASVAAYVAGVVRTEFGDYFLAFTSAGWLCFVAAALVLRIGRPSRRTLRDRRRDASPVSSPALGTTGSD
ncbi:MAG TPA: MFS transporter [Thermomicrobiales bacterium]|nr:MFS transporter [Thermomicrobiales bacterium]